MRTTALCHSDIVRPSVPSSATFVVGDWLVEPELNRVGRNGVSAHVRPQLMDLLVYLARNRGRTVPQDELLANLWPGQPFIANTALPRCIAELRQALGDRAAGSTVIQTVPKRGYRLIAVVGSHAEGVPTPARVPSAPMAVPEAAASPLAEASASRPANGASGNSRPDRRAFTWLRRARQLAARVWRP